MSESRYPDYFRHESSSLAELSEALRHELERLAAAGIDDYAVDFQPDLNYVEVRYQLTLSQALALGYSEAEIEKILPEAC